MISADPDVVVAIIGAITLLVAIGGFVYWLGKLSNRVDNLDKKVDQLDKKVDQLTEEVRKGFQDVREEMRRSQEEMREEMRRSQEEMREEMRRGNQQLLLALANHSHDADGQPIFRVPVSAE